MDISHYLNVIAGGFLVWLAMAPRVGKPQYQEKFLAYMVALLFSLVATCDIMLVKPVAFFFTVGGTFAFLYVVVDR